MNDDGSLDFTLHDGQIDANDSDKRFVVVLAGTQSGKTSFGPLWLYQEIQRRGPGDYLVVAPTYPLLALKALPELLRLFDGILQLGEYVGSPTRKFTFSAAGSRAIFGRETRIPTQIFFGHAQDPESLESATAKAAWLDEAGQNKFKLGSWEAILRRLSIHEGRVLITTTPYNLGWLKTKLHDPWEKAKRNHPDIDVINFASTMNPAFPRAEFERAKRDLPPWKFNMFYRGRFERPAGLIYDNFDPVRHVVSRFPIPDAWERYVGLDFGGVNTAGLFVAAEPGTGRFFAYREYHAGGRTAKQHAEALLAGEPRIPRAIGGAPSEGQWRNEFAAGGLPVSEPATKDVEVGINRVYGFHARNELYVFDDLAEYLDEKATYSRSLDDAGEPTEEIDDKNSYHLADAERYLLGWLDQFRGEAEFGLDQGGSVFDQIPEGVFES